MPKPPRKRKIHCHKFIVERFVFDSKTGNASHLDLRCDKCGMAMFVTEPMVHYGDESNRPYNVNVIQYEK